MNTQIKGSTVVIVTPDEAEHDRLTSILQEAGYVVRHAAYDMLVQAAMQHSPILIILDADHTMAPDPLPVLNALHTDARTREVPVMLLTAAFGGFDVSVWFKILEERRIVLFRKQYTPEYLVWFIHKYCTALAKDKNSRSSGE